MAELPKLPKPKPLACDYEGDMVYGYTADQMLVFQAATVEACAKVLDVLATDAQGFTEENHAYGYAAKQIRSLK